tara:strand:- start:64 stop:372 length:309 start_codon:yes stop_codon:yes gene_type:complete
MIDTDKYEGHAKEGWHFDSIYVLRDGYDKEIAELVGEDWLDDKATQELIADAPLLLVEVKRLREVMKKIGCSLCDECGLSIEEHIRYHTENDVIAGCPFGED